MSFFRSTTGRLLLLSIAVAFILGGGSALMQHGTESTVLFCVSLFAPIVINMIGVPAALEEDWYHVAISVGLLPQLFLLWAVGAGAIREHHPALAYPFMALGVVALAFAARPSSRWSFAQPILAPSH